jgi:hypothetical protein
LVCKAKHFIRNLSDYDLSDTEVLALSKGLSFIPTPKKPTKHVIMEAADESRGFQDFFIPTEDIFELDSMEIDPIS